MKRIGTVIFYIAAVVLMIIFFTPKRQLYYLGEKLAQEQGVVLSGEGVFDEGLALSLEDGTLYYQDLEIAKLNEVSILPLIVFNAIDVAPFSFSQEMQRFVPGTVEHIRVMQSAIDPLHVHVSASGDFGRLEGIVGLKDRNASLTLKPSKSLLTSGVAWLHELKKQPNGEYTYEIAF